MTVLTAVDSSLVDLSHIRETWLTEEFADALRESLRDQQFRSEVLAAITDAETTKAAAVAERRLDAAAVASARLDALRSVAGDLPGPTPTHHLATPCFDRATYDLRRALHELAPAELDYEISRDEWRATPADERPLDPPPPLPSDIDAIQIRGQLNDRLAEHRTWVRDVWLPQTTNPNGDAVALLRAGRGVLDAIEQLAREIEEFEPVASAANETRREAGLSQ